MKRKRSDSTEEILNSARCASEYLPDLVEANRFSILFRSYHPDLVESKSTWCNLPLFFTSENQAYLSDEDNNDRELCDVLSSSYALYLLTACFSLQHLRIVEEQIDKSVWQFYLEHLESKKKFVFFDCKGAICLSSIGKVGTGEESSKSTWWKDLTSLLQWMTSSNLTTYWKVDRRLLDMSFGQEGDAKKVAYVQSLFSSEEISPSEPLLQPLSYSITKQGQVRLRMDRKTTSALHQVISPWLLFYRLVILFGFKGQQKRSFLLCHHAKRNKKCLIRYERGVIEICTSPLPRNLRGMKWLRDVKELLNFLISDQICQPYNSTVAGLCS